MGRARVDARAGAISPACAARLARCAALKRTMLIESTDRVFRNEKEEEACVFALCWW